MKQKVGIILASGSPRRRQLLLQAGLEFRVLTGDIEERTEYTNPRDVVLDLAKQKGTCVSDIVLRNDTNAVEMFLNYSGVLVVSADTVVSMDNVILGKPVDEKDALTSLMKLSGRTHEVYTGVYCVYLSKDKDVLSVTDSFSFYSKTDVKMFSFTEAEALDYISTGEPMDKAGAYGIQGVGERLVEYIYGDYNNVVGFPLSRFMKELAERDYISFGS